MTGEKHFEVLFLCTGNSARSIIAEYLLRKTDRHRFEAYFAGPEDEHYTLFKEAGRLLARRIELFCNLPLEKLDRLRLEELTRAIGADAPVEA
jgi:low molecular weight phosphotyrosine protein phosphatase